MSDYLINLNQNPMTSWLVKAAGLPSPVELARSDSAYQARPLAGRRAMLLSTGVGFAAEPLRNALERAGAVVTDLFPPVGGGGEGKLDVVVMDATGCDSIEAYRNLYEGFHPILRMMNTNARVLLVSDLPVQSEDPVASALARGVEGFSRSLAKELGKFGTTVNLARLARDAADRLPWVVRFFCGVQCTFVSGQVVEVTSRVRAPSATPFERVLEGKVALVTGSARGIGLATARRLVQEGASVICLDVPAMAEELERVCADIGATALPLDITDAQAPEKLVAFVRDNHAGLDVVVHNAGITRDKTLANMKPEFWDQVVSVNLASILALDKALLAQGVLNDESRLVYLSSMSGVAGNYGQSNYAATKAALIGYVAAQAPLLAEQGICVNAIAPGFIETAMTDAMPFATREAGRRLNSLKQGGRPRDVAELICFLASPGASGISGNTIRVCGQNLIGA